MGERSATTRDSATRRQFLKGAAALGGVGLLAGCAPTAAPGATAVPSGTAAPSTRVAQLTWGASTDISRLNPQHSAFFVDVGVYDNVYDHLLHRDLKLAIGPGLATDWKLVNDTTWQYKLRSNAKFHNGVPVTAADIKFTIERTYDPNAKTSFPTSFATIQRIDVLDDATVNFVMKSPDPLLPARTAIWGGYIMPAKYFNEVGPEGFEKKPIGSGPYRVVEWVKDDRLVLEAVPDYWGGLPNADRIVVRPMGEPAVRVAALLAGDVQLIDEVPPDQISRIVSSGNAKVETVPYVGYFMVYVNQSVPPLNKKGVRQALSLSIDRQAIVKDLFLGYANLPNGSIPPGDFSYDSNVPPLPYDPQGARAALSQAGYAGEEIIWETIPSDRTISEAVVAMWKAVGINAKIELIESSVRAQKQTQRTFKGLWSSYPASALGDPDGMMWRLLAPGGNADYWRPRNEEFDRLGAEARVSLDSVKRGRNYTRMNEILRDEVPWMPIHTPNRVYAMAKNVQWKPFGNARVEFRSSNLSFSK